MNALSISQSDAKIQRRYIHGLGSNAFQVHFHARLLRIPTSDVAEGIQIKVCVQLTIDSSQDILVELGCDILSVVVGRHQNGRDS